MLARLSRDLATLSFVLSPYCILLPSPRTASNLYHRLLRSSTRPPTPLLSRDPQSLCDRLATQLPWWWSATTSRHSFPLSVVVRHNGSSRLPLSIRVRVSPIIGFPATLRDTPLFYCTATKARTQEFDDRKTLSSSLRNEGFS